jgi:hypothetical protein
MKDNKIIKFLIPLIAALVVFESVVLVTNLDKGTKTNTISNTTATNSATPSQQVINVEEPVMDMVFDTANKEVKIGKTYKVSLNIVAKKDLMVDGIETYIKYDPTLMTVSGLISNAKLPKANISKIDLQNGIIKNIILIDDKAGYKLAQGVVSQILSFNVISKKVGVDSFEISTGNSNKDFATLVVENSTVKALPFSGNKLEVNVTK